MPVVPINSWRPLGKEEEEEDWLYVAGLGQFKSHFPPACCISSFVHADRSLAEHTPYKSAEGERERAEVRTMHCNWTVCRTTQGCYEVKHWTPKVQKDSITPKNKYNVGTPGHWLRFNMTHYLLLHRRKKPYTLSSCFFSLTFVQPIQH